MKKNTPEKAVLAYGKISQDLTRELDNLRPKLSAFVLYRLIAFLGAVVVWFFYDSLQNWSIAVCLAFLAVFFVLVKKNNELKVKKKFLEAELDLVQQELAVIDGEFSQLYDGAGFRDDDHPFVLDLDIFGQRSLYQYLNRTQTVRGRNEFATWLKFPLNSADAIETRQEAVAELALKTQFRIELFAATSQIEEDESSVENFLSWVSSPITGIGSKSKPLFFLIPLYSVASILAYSFDFIGLIGFLVAYFAPLLIVMYSLSKINAVYNDLGKYHRTLGNYAQAFEKIESVSYHSTALRESAENALGASKALGELSRIISAFDNRNNFLLAIFLNASFLWDIRCVRRLERWREEHKTGAEKWFDALATFESMSSLATFQFNRSEQVCVPQLTEKPLVSAKGLVHPLMNFAVAVPNDFETNDFGDFSIITGANMAGKSTFLRALGVSYLTAMIGGPVVAKSFSFRPVFLFTSMRTSDSLQDNESYFYAELKRLQMIVEHLEKDEQLFIILDEILKGTNSTDKAEGSKKFMEKLLNYNAAGVIATHDLSLCEIEKRHPENVTNRYFDVEIKDDDLYFDYTLRNGICSNMNATFLMKKMGITS